MPKYTKKAVRKTQKRRRVGRGSRKTQQRQRRRRQHGGSNSSYFFDGAYFGAQDGNYSSHTGGTDLSPSSGFVRQELASTFH